MAVIDDGQALAQPIGLFHVMSGQQNGPSRMVVFANDLPQENPGLRIEPGARFVEKQDLWIVHHGAGNGKPLHHASGEAAHHLVRAFGELELLEQRVGALISLS
jgi:hypothetical protein